MPDMGADSLDPEPLAVMQRVASAEDLMVRGSNNGFEDLGDFDLEHVEQSIRARETAQLQLRAVRLVPGYNPLRYNAGVMAEVGRAVEQAIEE